MEIKHFQKTKFLSSFPDIEQKNSQDRRNSILHVQRIISMKKEFFKKIF